MDAWHTANRDRCIGCIVGAPTLCSPWCASPRGWKCLPALFIGCQPNFRRGCDSSCQPLQRQTKESRRSRIERTSSSSDGEESLNIFPRARDRDRYLAHLLQHVRTERHFTRCSSVVVFSGWACHHVRTSGDDGNDDDGDDDDYGNDLDGDDEYHYDDDDNDDDDDDDDDDEDDADEDDDEWW